MPGGLDIVFIIAALSVLVVLVERVLDATNVRTTAPIVSHVPWRSSSLHATCFFLNDRTSGGQFLTVLKPQQPTGPSDFDRCQHRQPPEEGTSRSTRATFRSH